MGKQKERCKEKICWSSILLGLWSRSSVTYHRKSFTKFKKKSGAYKVSLAKHVGNQRSPVIVVVDVAHISTNLSKVGKLCYSAGNRAICTGCSRCTTRPLTGHSYVLDYHFDSDAVSRDRFVTIYSLPETLSGQNIRLWVRIRKG